MMFERTTLAATSGLLLVAAASGQTTRDESRLNTTGLNLNGDNRVDGAVIAVRGTTFYAAWTDQFGTTEFTQDIYFATSIDDGATWSAQTRVDLGDAANASDSDAPKIAVTDNGNVVVIWEDKRDGAAQGTNNEDVLYNLSTDGGATWLSTALPLNTHSSGSNVGSDVDRLWLTAEGDTFHATWEEDFTAGIGGSEEVFYTRSTDAGVTWSTPVIISTPSGADDVDEPKVEASGDLVVITYIDVNNDVVAHRSTDNGATFDQGVVIETDTAGDADEAILDVEGDTVLVAWTENTTAPGGEGVHCCVSNDGGVTYRAEEILSVQQEAIAGSDADSPKVVIQSANNMFVVYDEDSLSVQAGNGGGSAGNEVYIAHTNDGGATWTKDVPLNQGNASNRPYVVATSGAVVVWMELNGNGGNEAAFTFSADSGATWAPVTPVTPLGPDIDEGAARDEGVYVAISDMSNTTMATHMNRGTGANEVYTSGFLLTIGVGMNYCTAEPNSTGVGGEISAVGSIQAADNSLRVTASELPQNSFGFFLTSQMQGLVMNPGGSQGSLCLGGAIGRYVGPGQIQNSGQGGEFSLSLDLSRTPTPTGLDTVMPGDTWNFTAWFRDAVGGQATSNFTNGIQIDFL